MAIPDVAPGIPTDLRRADRLSPEARTNALVKTERKPRATSKRTVPPKDKVDIASMDSFPCSDPPGYYSSHC